jgi:hypothetical protein
MTEPMTAARFAALIASADTKEALQAQRLDEAERMGRLAGFLLIRGRPSR